MTLFSTEHTKPLVQRSFIIALLINAIWINISEVFRYFAFVMPMMRDAFPMITNIAPMNLSVFLIWGFWDTILVFGATAILWMIQERSGRSTVVALASGTFVWAIVFVILWLGLWNMNIATPAILAIALPLAWLEMIVAAFIVSWAMHRRVF